MTKLQIVIFVMALGSLTGLISGTILAWITKL